MPLEGIPVCFFHKSRIVDQPIQSFQQGHVIHSVSFAQLPSSFAEFQKLLEGKERDPFQVAALSLLALCLFSKSPELAFQAYGSLLAPILLSERERSFIKERLQGKTYKPFSYFEGATPANDYTPNYPLIVRLKEEENSTQEKGYLTLYLTSGGAASPRPIRLRERNDGTWALWEEFLLADIIAPKKDNPWA